MALQFAQNTYNLHISACKCLFGGLFSCANLIFAGNHAHTNAGVQTHETLRKWQQRLFKTRGGFHHRFCRSHPLCACSHVGLQPPISSWEQKQTYVWKTNLSFAPSTTRNLIFTTRHHKPLNNGWGRGFPLAQPTTGVYVRYYGKVLSCQPSVCMIHSKYFTI